MPPANGRHAPSSSASSVNAWSSVAGITRASLGDADVVVEFSVPDAAPANIRAIVDAGIPVVVGTTGWYSELDAIKAHVATRDGALLTATNFSLGVNIFEQIIATAAGLVWPASAIRTSRS